MTAGDVARFLTTQLPTMTRKTAQMTACALRSFLARTRPVGTKLGRYKVVDDTLLAFLQSL